jgi:Ca-activated chloride channel family protein
VTIERPQVFLFLLALIPVLVNGIFRLRALWKIAGAAGLSDGLFRIVKRRMVLRSACWIAAFVLLITALSGVSWGSASVPVQRSGAAVSLVFDISWSMTARDAGGDMTRLEAASLYAEALLSHLAGTAVSVVLAKGGGITAVPLTEDINTVMPLLQTLSPQLMTAAGSDISRGIDAAVRSFPATSGAAPVIVVFTDGEETSGSMAESVAASIRYGIPVFFVGFGSEFESEIISGDGETPVLTALRSENLRNAVIPSANSGSRFQQVQAQYIEAAAPGSAAAILKAITRNAEHGVIFESRPVARYRVFLVLALLFFMAGIALSEFRVKRFVSSAAALPVLALFVCLPMLQSCSGSISDMAQVLGSAYNWRRGDYQEAVAGFLAITDIAQQNGDHKLLQYGLYGLASTYMMQGEYGAALERLNEIAPDSPDDIRYAVLYNSGIIAYHNGGYSDAKQFFRQALEVNRTSVNAKVNLEIASGQTEVQAVPAEQEVIPAAVQDNQNAAQNALFSIIREDEQNRWKNSQTQTEKSSGLDY